MRAAYQELQCRAALVERLKRGKLVFGNIKLCKLGQVIRDAFKGLKLIF